MPSPETHLSPEIIEQIRCNSPEDLPSAGYYDLLVSLAGFSPQTTAQAYLVLKPANLHIIHSKDTEKELPAIKQEIRNGRPAESKSLEVQYTQDECCPTDPLSIYKSVKKQIDTIRKSPDQTAPKVVIDITGGKKVMSAAAALAAWQLNTDLVYAENDSYDEIARGPQDKTQAKLLRLPNPMTLFREQEEARIDALFNAGQFERAVQDYTILSDRILDSEAAGSAKYRVCLAKLYTAWCDFDHKGLRDQLVKLNKTESQKYLTSMQNRSLSRQVNFLSDFINSKPPAIIYPVMFYFLGLHYQGIGRYDFSGQLFYRCLETIFRSRLELRFSGFKTAKADFSHIISKLPADPKRPVKSEPDLEKLYMKTSSSLTNFDQTKRLPRQLMYVTSAVLLKAIDDDLMKKGGFQLSRLQDIGNSRNKCFLNHGDANITKADCELLRSSAADLLKALHSFHPYQPRDEAGGVKDILEYVKALAFIKFKQS